MNHKANGIKTRSGANGVQKEKSLWLNAFHDRVAGIPASKSCMCLSDVFGDGEVRLVVAEYKSKILKMWKGTTLESELKLLDTPVGVVSYYSDQAQIPSLAVAAGPHLYIYRKFRAYYKFTLPDIDFDLEERSIWESVQKEELTLDKAHAMLTDLSTAKLELSHRSKKFISFRREEDWLEYGNRVKNKPLVEQTVINCVTAIPQQLDDPKSPSVLIIGTENCKIHILEIIPKFRIIKTISLVSSPMILSASGVYALGYRVAIITREGKILSVKDGELSSAKIEPESYPVDLIRTTSTILVACMNNCINCYHPRGKKLYSLLTPSPVQCMEMLILQQSNSFATLVGLSNGEIRLYNEKNLVSTVNLDEPIYGIKFGRFGRESNTMLCTTKSGALDIRIMSRSAKIDTLHSANGPPPEQDIPINIPKKTRIYVGV